MNSRQWQQHATTSSPTAVQENQHSSLCSEVTQSTSSTLCYMQQEGTSMMTMVYQT